MFDKDFEKFITDSQVRRCRRWRPLPLWHSIPKEARNKEAHFNCKDAGLSCRNWELAETVFNQVDSLKITFHV